MIVGIDASTLGSGGAKRHLIEVIQAMNPRMYGFEKIKIWGTQELLEQIPESVYIEKTTHSLLNKGFLFRSVWQLFYRDRCFKNTIDVLFNPFGTYIGSFRPYVTMSRNMLVFDKVEQRKFGLTWYRLKFSLLFYVQKKSFRNAQGVIFISQYAKEVVGKYIDYKKIATEVIHHGVSDIFRKQPKKQALLSSYTTSNPFVFLYVSTIFNYKNQLKVVEAIVRLRKKGFPVVLRLVGNVGQKEVGSQLKKKIRENDPNGLFITWEQNIGLNEIMAYYHKSDAFIFASSCENMPNILIEAMAAGLPILCSSSSPMPEFLKDGGVYFTADNSFELETTLINFLQNTSLRSKLAEISFDHSKQYSWQLCANKTFNFLNSVCKKHTP